MGKQFSQVAAIGGPSLETWDDYEAGCLATYAGGHHDDGHLDAFQHGMRTVFNLLRNEFPTAQQCKAAPALQDACQAYLDWEAAETKRMPAYSHTECVALLIQAERLAREAIALATGGIK